MRNLINNLKDSEQDFEFYPTSDRIIACVNRLRNSGDILDIGCGNGQTLMKLEGFGTKYGIEKSEILINKCNPEIIIIGTDFNNQTLIDKDIENVFCNPPYSEFKEWTKKILKESTAKKVILVIPQRWREDGEIQEIIKERAWSEYTAGNFDFLDGERAARAIVDVVVFSKSQYRGKSAFDMFFEETFTVKKEEVKKETVSQKVENELVEGGDLVKTLVRLHDTELAHIFDNYQKIESLDASLLKELNVKVDDVKKGLKLRISGLKTLYWQELFSKFNKILQRLSFKYRTELREKLSSNVDFNESNIYAVTVWVIKNTNQYIDKQMVDLFETMTEEKNITNYKSNQKTWEKEDFRFNRKQDITRYKLEHRIILELWGTEYLKEGEFAYQYHSRDDNNRAKMILNDILAVAYNFGYIVDSLPLNGWEYGESRDINYHKDGAKVFMSVKIFKKGTIHIKFCQEFIQQLNVEVSRLKGWVRSKQEAAQELSIPEKDVERYFKKSVYVSNNKNLLN